MSSDGLELEIELLDIANNGWTRGRGPWWHERVDVVEHADAVELRATAVNVRGEQPTYEPGRASVRLTRPLNGRPVLDLFSTTLCRPERAPTSDQHPDGQLVSVPFWKAEPAGADRIVVWWTSSPGHRLIDVDLRRERNRVVVTLCCEQQGWSESIAEERATVVHAPGIDPGIEIVDGTTGQVPEPFVPDLVAAWARFDDAVAAVVLGIDDERDLAVSAGMALEYGCEGAALTALRDRRGSFIDVLRQRGLEPPDRRTAATRLVDTALARARDGGGTPAETIGLTIAEIARRGRLDPDHAAQLAPLVKLYRTWERVQDDDDAREVQDSRFTAACQALRESGGLRT